MFENFNFNEFVETRQKRENFPKMLGNLSKI